ncbi:MAG: malto-oligosyltrehalose trehalohydrolase [Bryobacteraceae bacterium]|nr:malto-oligosyltrehalose trehalohydrolase [Bryobacteraceae bacterium]
MWEPLFGAICAPGEVRFALWASDAEQVELTVERPEGVCHTYPMAKSEDGLFRAAVSSVRAGDRYRYRADGKWPYPDPASRYQPDGVHGPSEVIDPAAFSWTDGEWRGIPLQDTVFYELHVGAFTPAGTFDAARARLPYLRDLGINAVELMPVADFPGQRNWGYDGVALFAPARCYGRPDDLRRFVDEAHCLGLAVYLDVVYNHFGPDGAYAVAFSPMFFSPRHQSPWGAGINLDDEGSAHVRRYFIENALHWLHEYHIDGLRLDATHVLVDDSPRHFLAELSSRVRASFSAAARCPVLIAEDTSNDQLMLLPEEDAGWQLDAVWSDDFHHQVRRHLTGDAEGYYIDFTGSMEDLVHTVRRGWFFTGQYAPHFQRNRGTDTARLPLDRFVFFIQNHDQIGNRAFGDRLNHAIEPALYHAVTVLLMLAPETPLLFMGQEWAASTPFQFFTDHYEDLGKLVTAGRRREFAGFASFSDPQRNASIPDPQALSTFETSKLAWEERDREPHASTLRLYRRLLQLRRDHPALQSRRREDLYVTAVDEGALAMCRQCGSSALLVLVRTAGRAEIDLSTLAMADPGPGQTWTLLLSTEDPDFTAQPAPVRLTGTPPVVAFERPGAVVFRGA